MSKWNYILKKGGNEKLSSNNYFINNTSLNNRNYSKNYMPLLSFLLRIIILLYNKMIIQNNKIV
jgi:hypothetical protein